MTDGIPGVKGGVSSVHTAPHLKSPLHRPEGDVRALQAILIPVAMGKRQVEDDTGSPNPACRQVRILVLLC